MNLCFFIGKIVSDIEFEFVLKSKHTSIVMFEILLNNGSKIKIKGYDNIADKCYRKLVKGDIIGVQGYLNSNMWCILVHFGTGFNEPFWFI